MWNESTIIAAIIGAAATIFCGIIVAYKDEIMSIFSRRDRRVSGTWEGRAKYWTSMCPSDKFERSFVCELRQRGKKISGKLSSTSRPPGDTGAVYYVKGECLETEFITLTINNKESETINYATSVLKFSKGGRQMAGDLVGRSRKLDGIVSGNLIFVKISDNT